MFQSMQQWYRIKKNLETYIAKHANEKTLLASQSGGGFTAISNWAKACETNKQLSGS